MKSAYIYKAIKTSIFIFLIIFSNTRFSYSQCPQFYDFDGFLSSIPKWIVCDGNEFNLSLKSNEDIGNYSIDWGDGNTINTNSQIINYNYENTSQEFQNFLLV